MIFRHKYIRVLISLILTLILVSSTSYGNIKSYALPDMSVYQDQLKDFISAFDEDTISEAFDFLQEKIAEGKLDTESGIEEAIRQGKEKFDIDIEGNVSEEHIRSMLELATTLEEMGFNSESIIEHARSLYEEHGVNFVDHTEELFIRAVKESIWNTIKNAIISFFQSMGSFLRELFSFS